MSLMKRVEGIFESLRTPSPAQLSEAINALEMSESELSPHLGTPGVFPYGRKLLYQSSEVEVLVMNWATDRECSPHDHGQSFGWVMVVSGTAVHRLFTLNQADVPVEFGVRKEETGRCFFAPRGMIHSMGNMTVDPLVTLHVYSPPITNMKVYDLLNCSVCVVSDDCGAWWPQEQRQIVRELKLSQVPATFALDSPRLD